ncbi:MAG: CinA family protein [Pseudomonadota bacterium]
MSLLQDLHPQALRIATALRARGERIAVADGATGGLIMASLLTVPGALDFFKGGGVVYSLKARNVLFDLPREAYDGMTSATEDYALLQARAIRDQMGADWGIAESGSVGGSSHPTGAPSGRSAVAIAAPSDMFVTCTIETHSEDRIENMFAFTRNALEALEDALDAAGAAD